MLVVAALALSSVATAQFRLDEAGLKKKIASADADVQDSKKGARAATWITRGNAYYNADVAPTAPLRGGMSATEINLVVGKAAETREETIGPDVYQVWVYPHFDLYLSGDQLVFWKQKTVIVSDGLQRAFESYVKAAELDPKQTEKMREEVTRLIDQANQFAYNDFVSRDFGSAVSDFVQAYDFSTAPLINTPDTAALYNAGYISVLSQKYDEAIKYLEQAKEMGYGNDGEVFLYLYHAYNGKEDVAGAERVLKEGMIAFPANDQLLEALIVLYSNTGQDPSQIIPLVQEAISRNPDDYALQFSLGLIYNKLEQFDQAVEQYKKAFELNPQDFASAFNIGLTYQLQADAMLPQINAIPYNQTALIEQKTAEFNALYKESIPYFERAYTLNPTDRTTVEILRSIFFRLRDESPEMMQNYEKYNEILKSL